MLILFICAFVVSCATDVACSQYDFRPAIQGWISSHRVLATWDEANRQCEREGAVLMSPTTEDMRNEMIFYFRNQNVQHHTGIRSKFVKGIFVSVEGVLLETMPVTYLIEQLDPENGQCLAMNTESIRVVSCDTRLPYLCYKKQKEDMKNTECGTIDTGYKFVKSTGSCYKPHYNLTLWGDAYSTCIAEGGYLAIVNNAFEAQILVKDVIKVKSHYILIGLVDWKGTDDWRSINGEPIEQLHNVWKSGDKPNTSSSCGTLDPDEPKLKPFGNCLSTTKFYFLCEKDPSKIIFPFEEQQNLYVSNSESPYIYEGMLKPE